MLITFAVPEPVCSLSKPEKVPVFISKDWDTDSTGVVSSETTPSFVICTAGRSSETFLSIKRGEINQ